jgi:hypothetical protein
MQGSGTAPPLESPQPQNRRTATDLIAAIQASPYREIEIEPSRYPMPAPAVTL